MALILTTQWFGTFIVEDDEVRQSILFPMEAEAIAERLNLLHGSEILDEEKELVRNLSEEERSDLLADDIRLSPLVSGTVETMELDPREFGYDPAILREASMLMAREAVSVNVEKDKHISQAIDMVDELTKHKNILCERFAEWYNIYFPEAVSAAGHEELVKAVLDSDERDGAARVLDRPELAEKHTGSDVSDDEKKQFRQLAGLISEVNKCMDRSQDYIRRSMEDTAPNLAVLAGPNVGAKLISLAGSLERLSKMPASTIQMLGAEKALFRFLKHKGKPPKHGAIFMHPRIHAAPYWQRGKIARTFAAKLALASKVDYHSGRDISEDLLEQLEKQMEQIREKYPEPPKRPERKDTGRGHGKDRRGSRGKGKRKRGKKGRK